MKKNIHPVYEKISVFCMCGNKMKIYSTLLKNLNLDVCGLCHPFYTGKQRIVDSSGRIDKFNKRLNFSK